MNPLAYVSGKVARWLARQHTPNARPEVTASPSGASLPRPCGFRTPAARVVRRCP